MKRAQQVEIQRTIKYNHKMTLKIGLFLIYLIAHLNSCNSQNRYLIIINTDSCSSCSNCVQIDYSIESNLKINILLREYIYSSLIGGYECISQYPDSFFQKQSFKKCIMLIYLDSLVYYKNYYETKERYNEMKKELLYKCKDKEVLYELSDTLLKYDIFDGVEVLWDDTVNIDRLKYSKKYLEAHENNFFIKASYATIYHNLGQLKKRDHLLEELKNMKKFNKEFINLNNLMKKNGFINLDTFNEQIIY